MKIDLKYLERAVEELPHTSDETRQMLNRMHEGFEVSAIDFGRQLCSDIDREVALAEENAYSEGYDSGRVSAAPWEY